MCNDYFEILPNFTSKPFSILHFRLRKTNHNIVVYVLYSSPPMELNIELYTEVKCSMETISIMTKLKGFSSFIIDLRYSYCGILYRLEVRVNHLERLSLLELNASCRKPRIKRWKPPQPVYHSSTENHRIFCPMPDSNPWQVLREGVLACVWL